MTNLPEKWSIPADAGFSTFPVRKGSKVPAVQWTRWQSERPSLDQLQSWAANDTNIGIVTGKISGIIALDLDNAEAHDEAVTLGLPHTVMSKTPRGVHIFFRFPDYDVSNTVRLFPGADIRGEGGYVVAAGSKVFPTPEKERTGKLAGDYYWINAPADTPLAPLPLWLDMMLREKGRAAQNVPKTKSAMPAHSPYGQAAVEGELGKLVIAPHGSRNDTLNEAAFKLGQLAAKGQVQPEQAKGALADCAERIGLDPLEIVPTINSGWAAGMLCPRADNDNDPDDKPPKANSMLPLLWLEDIEPKPEQQWLIRHWLPAKGLGAIYGHPGTGKSFLALDMCLAIASGQPWGGYRTIKGMALYIVAEGETGFARRVQAARLEKQLPPDTPFAMIPSPVDLCKSDTDTERVIELLEWAAKERGVKPAILVIDTLARTIGAGDENTSDMSAYVNNCQKIADWFDCLAFVVHHRPKDRDSKDMRGHSSLRGALDVAIRLEGEGDRHVAIITKQKDGPDNLRIGYRLCARQIGFDIEGEPIESCVVELFDAPQKKAQLSPRQLAIISLGKNPKALWDALPGLIAKHGQPCPADLEGDAPAVVFDSKAFRPELGAVLAKVADCKPENVARTIRTAIGALTGKGLIANSGHWLWIVPETDESPV